MPAIAWTYNTLMQALQDWEVHSSVKFLANMPNIIGLGERRLWGDLNVEEYDKTDNTSTQMVIGTRTVNKPADTIVIRTAGYYLPAVAGPPAQGPKFVGLEKRSGDYCQAFAPDATVQGPPQYYHELAFNQIEVVPTPDKAYQVYWRYIGTPTESLTPVPGTTSTWLSRAGPDALFAACLMEAEHYIKADDRYADYQAKYGNELLPRLREEVRNAIRAGDYSPYKPAAAPAAG